MDAGERAVLGGGDDTGKHVLFELLAAFLKLLHWEIWSEIQTLHVLGLG